RRRHRTGEQQYRSHRRTNQQLPKHDLTPLTLCCDIQPSIRLYRLDAALLRQFREFPMEYPPRRTREGHSRSPRPKYRGGYFSTHAGRALSRRNTLAARSSMTWHLFSDDGTDCASCQTPFFPLEPERECPRCGTTTSATSEFLTEVVWGLR